MEAQQGNQDEDGPQSVNDAGYRGQQLGGVGDGLAERPGAHFSNEYRYRNG